MFSSVRKIYNRLVHAKCEEAPHEKVYVAAFGKHPGWDDHIEGVGLDTEMLASVKQFLYDGFCANIDGGAWARLQEEKGAIPFGHFFVWSIHSDYVAGRLWASEDGKGRAMFPMIVCVQCSGLGAEWVWSNVVPRLVELQAACNATRHAERVRERLSDARTDLRELAIAPRAEASTAVPSSNVFSELACLPEMGQDHRGFMRVLYHLQQEIERFQLEPAARKSKSQTTDIRPRMFRVPILPDQSVHRLDCWLSFLRQRLGANVGLFLLVPDDRPWMDICVGQPDSQQLFCVRAPLKAIPAVSEIPYTLPFELVEEIQRTIDSTVCDSR